jgi:outer membrane protein TolC
VTFINVLTATTTELNARDEVEQSTQALAQDQVSLYKAMGGGWRPMETQSTGYKASPATFPKRLCRPA